MPHWMLSLLCYFIFFCDNFYTNRVTCHFIIYKEGLITILFHFFFLERTTVLGMPFKLYFTCILCAHVIPNFD